MKRLQIPQKLVYEKFYVHEKKLRIRNCRRGFIKNLLPKKRKENAKVQACHAQLEGPPLLLYSVKFKVVAFCVQSRKVFKGWRVVAT